MKHLMNKTKSKNINELARNIAFKKSEWHEKQAKKMIVSEDEGDSTTSTDSNDNEETLAADDGPNNEDKVKSTGSCRLAGNSSKVPPAEEQSNDRKETKKKKKKIKRRDHLSYSYDSASSLNLHPHPSVFLKQVEYFRDCRIKPILVTRHTPNANPYPTRRHSLNQLSLINSQDDQHPIKESGSAHLHQGLLLSPSSTEPTSSMLNNSQNRNCPTTEEDEEEEKDLPRRRRLPPRVALLDGNRKKKNLTFKEPLSSEGCCESRKSADNNCEDDCNEDSDGMREMDNEYEYFYDFSRRELDQIERKARISPPREEIEEEFWRTQSKVTKLFPLDSTQTTANGTGTVRDSTTTAAAAHRLTRQQLQYEQGLAQISLAIQLPYTDNAGNAITPAFQVSETEDYMAMLAVVASEKREQGRSSARSDPLKEQVGARGGEEKEEEERDEEEEGEEEGEVAQAKEGIPRRKRVAISKLNENSFSSSNLRGGAVGVEEQIKPEIQISAEENSQQFIRTHEPPPAPQTATNNNPVSLHPSKSSREEASTSTQPSNSSTHLDSSVSLVEKDSTKFGMISQPKSNNNISPTTNRMVSEVAVSDSIPSENADSESIYELGGDSKSETKSCSCDPTCLVNLTQPTSPRTALSAPGRVEAGKYEAITTNPAYSGRRAAAVEGYKPSPTAATAAGADPRMKKADSAVMSPDQRKGKDEEMSGSVKLENIRIRPESIHKMLRLQREILSQPDKYNDPNRFDAFDLVELDYEGMERYLKFLVFHSLLRDQQERRAKRSRSNFNDGRIKLNPPEDLPSLLPLQEQSVSKGLCSRIKNFLSIKLNSVRFCSKQKSCSVRPASEQDIDQEGDEQSDRAGSVKDEETTTTTTVAESYVRRRLLQCEIEGRDVTDSDCSYSTCDDLASSVSSKLTARLGAEARGTSEDVVVPNKSSLLNNGGVTSSSSEILLGAELACEKRLRKSTSAGAANVTGLMIGSRQGGGLMGKTVCISKSEDEEERNKCNVMSTFERKPFVVSSKSIIKGKDHDFQIGREREEQVPK